MKLYLHYFLFYRGVDTDIFTTVFSTCNTVVLESKLIGHVSETQEKHVTKSYLEYREETYVFSTTNYSVRFTEDCSVIDIYMYVYILSGIAVVFSHQLKENFTFV
jgi:hypothetical protein